MVPCGMAYPERKVPPSSIQLRVMASTCSAGDVTALTVSVNGAQKGTLGIAPGTGGTFQASSDISNVIVVAKYANGAESVVYQNAAL